MARPKTPSNVLDAKGAFKKNPGRKNKNEPVVESLFPSSPPSHLSAKQKKIWNEVKKISPAGVLTGADIYTVEIISVLIDEFRTEGGDFLPAKLTRLSSELKSIGLNPSGRAGLKVDLPPVNEFL